VFDTLERSSPVKKWEIIKAFFGKDSVVGTPKLSELKSLSKKDGDELATLAAREMGVTLELPKK